MSVRQIPAYADPMQIVSTKTVCLRTPATCVQKTACGLAGENGHHATQGQRKGGTKFLVNDQKMEAENVVAIMKKDTVSNKYLKEIKYIHTTQFATLYTEFF